MAVTKRYGAAEIFGQAVPQMTALDLRQVTTADHKLIPCPFKVDRVACHKKGGVSSLAVFEKATSGEVQIAGLPVTTCPARFYESNTVYSWVGE